MLEWIKNNFKELIKVFIYWLMRISTLFTIIILSLMFFGYADEIIKTTILIIYFSCIAIVISGLYLYLYTRIRFTSYLTKGEDNKYSEIERAAVIKLLGNIVIGVCVLVSVVILSVYAFQYAPPAIENNKVNTNNVIDSTNIND